MGTRLGRTSTPWGFVLIAAMVVAALATAVMVDPEPLAGELATVRWLQRLPEPVPWTAELVRTTTGTEATLIAGAAPAVWLVSRRSRQGALAVGIALATMLVAQPLLKEIVDRPRPNSEQVEVRATHESKSFPSGHSMSTTTAWGAAAALAWRSGRRPLAAAAAVPIAVTGVASSVQGVHWPSDAIAGTLLGALAAVAILAVLTGGERASRPD